MSRVERAKMVLAMEYIVRNTGADDIIDGWLTCGVADGDIEYGENDPNTVDDCYLEDEEFISLMDSFLITMNRAYKDGGLYCDKIASSIG